MPYTGLTNPTEAAARYVEQAGYDPLQQQAIVAGHAQTGVISGCAVTAQGTPDTTVAVASGTVIVGGTIAAVTSGGVAGFTAPAAGLRRIDLVVADNTGAKSRLAGAAVAPADATHAGPVWPSSFDPTVYAVLAEVTVDDADSVVVAGCIIDKRVMVTSLATQAELDAEAVARAAGDSALTTAVGLKAADSAVVHNTGAETVAGVKTFSSIPVVPDGSFSAAKLAFDVATQAELDAEATARASGDAAAVQRANHTGTQLASTVSDFAEAVDDRVGALLVAGANVTLAYNDAAGTLTVAAGDAGQEVVEDLVAALVDDNSDLDWTYDDGTGSLVAVIKPGSVTNTMLAGSIALAKLATDPLARANHTGTQTAATVSDFTEAVQDVVGALGFGGSGLTATYDDTANTLTLTVNVDDSSIEVNADTLRVKASGITNAMLAGSIALSKLATDPLARANHTGTQTASTVSDFDTQVATTAVLKSLFDANTVLAANTDNTPAALTMGASTILARLAAGNIVAATPAELKTLLAIAVADISDIATTYTRVASYPTPTADSEKVTFLRMTTAADTAKKYVVMSVFVDNLQDGDLLVADAGLQFTNDHTYMVIPNTYITFATSPGLTTGTEMCEAAGTNVDEAIHHQLVERHGEHTISGGVTSGYVNFVVYAAGTSVIAGDVLRVETDYGRTFVKRFRGHSTPTVTIPAAATPPSVAANYTDYFADDLGAAASSISAWAPNHDGLSLGNLIQATGANQPTVQVSSLFNGRKVARFDGVSDYLKTALLGSDLAQPWGLVVVGRYVTAPGVAASGFWTDGGDATHRSIISTGSVNAELMRIFAGSTVNEPGMNDGDGTVAVDLEPHMLRFYASGASSTFERDGDLLVTGNANTHAFNALTLGANQSGASTFANVEIAFARIVNGTMSAGELTNLENWVRDTYGISMSA